jgi:hypothetical protein
MLKLDTYTKAVLTLILVALFWLCITLNTTPVQADGVMRVVIAGVDIPNGKGGVRPVGLVATGFEVHQGSYEGRWTHLPLPVVLSNQNSVKKQK